MAIVWRRVGEFPRGGRIGAFAQAEADAEGGAAGRENGHEPVATEEAGLHVNRGGALAEGGRL